MKQAVKNLRSDEIPGFAKNRSIQATCQTGTLMCNDVNLTAKLPSKAFENIHNAKRIATHG